LCYRDKSRLFPNDLHQHPLLSAPVELPVQDLLPRPEVQPPLGYCHHDFPPHDLPLDVRVGVVLAGVVVALLAHRLVRSDLLQPGFIVVMQSRFVVVDEHRGRDVHWIYQSFTITTIGYLLRWLTCPAERGGLCGAKAAVSGT
jgi:hypothetical protein